MPAAKKSSAKTKAASAQAKTVAAPRRRASDDPVESIKASILDHLTHTFARDTAGATPRDWFLATAMSARDHLTSRLIKTQSAHNDQNVRRLYYLSLEYLMGRLLISSLQNAGVYDHTRQALEELGVDWEALRASEDDMGLGNGGLGRLAACFIDSLATLDLPAIGYGINYEFGLFRQAFENGHQVENPDSWMIYGTPWELMHPEYQQEVQIYGEVENVFDDSGNYRPQWVNTHKLVGVPNDIPVPGYGTETVNILRLWTSHATEPLDLNAFNEGGYVEAVRNKATSETISKVLYPNDKTENGKELRLVQQYFFVACSLKDIIRRHMRVEGNGWHNFADKVAVQLNDTHPAIAVAELLRILIDEESLDWDEAWAIITKTFAYTNHTLLPEALEKWGVPLYARVLPRHLQLIYEINRRHLETVAAKWPGDNEMLSTCSIVEEGGGKQLRMAHLAVVGSHAVNGVAALHTELLKKDLFPYFDTLFPGKFRNKTNGITPRRWLLDCNPALSALITKTLGRPDWPRNLDLLQALGKEADQPAFQQEFMAIKRVNKVALAETIQELCGIEVSPDALFDVQIKRLHEYKRQHLNLLHIVALYRRLLQNPDLDMVPRVFVFAAKAAPGYDLAKNIIRAINVIGARINHDERIQGKLKVAFLPNYRVTLAEKIIPAADLSEQISTAGKEASGTGNMKLALNGALTIGTLDGANVEIGEEVGDDNIFIFGMTVEEVEAVRNAGYRPYDFYYADEELRAVIDWIGSDYFTPGERHAFAPLHHSLLDGGDPYMVLADFRSYSDAHLAVDAAYRDSPRWAKMAIMNTARVGKFSSDRTIREYAEDIWNLPPVPVK
ncbi:glycogen/starch/alpha-glucan phosphorylase [Synoicihabitans lomoniglobus]|uniref:Alpha-1,4 glucan phosphorylase n=1 Tax=Synoicihabitans lomoniglobus TaxID=2909285 RepID=A0AAF0CMA8_9BACT|nr:glycogen/starch/alpha-glucan phosphorylase [Opitutaceae bacterium LMO-M01]WED63036.1 glycogen/starch/alpha-glucan phosphorylase [Opitutaceae bacterium LMO-M01]